MTPEKRAAVTARARVVAEGMARYRAIELAVAAEKDAEWWARGHDPTHATMFALECREESSRLSGFDINEQDATAFQDWADFAELIAEMSGTEGK